MDFRQSSVSPVSKPETAVPGVTAPQHSGKKKGLSDAMPTWLNWLNVVILFGIAMLLVLMSISLARSAGSSTTEAKLVDSSKYQAVFLNNGQVYFGNISSINNDYVRLNNIYYLTQSSDTSTNTQSTSGDYTLVKLGCQQIHYPYDQMIVNRSQITFWENLNKDGKVAKSIEQFKTQNPKGPDCTQVSSQTQSDGTSTQGSTTTTNTTNKQ